MLVFLPVTGIHTLQTGTHTAMHPQTEESTMHQQYELYLDLDFFFHALALAVGGRNSLVVLKHGGSTFPNELFHMKINSTTKTRTYL